VSTLILLAPRARHRVLRGAPMSGDVARGQRHRSWRLPSAPRSMAPTPFIWAHSPSLSFILPHASPVVVPSPSPSCLPHLLAVVPPPRCSIPAAPSPRRRRSVSHPVLEGKANANHIRVRIRNSRTQRLHNWTSSHIAQNNSGNKYFITSWCPKHPQSH
jgi:hypothetical protein